MARSISSSGLKTVSTEQFVQALRSSRAKMFNGSDIATVRVLPKRESGMRLYWRAMRSGIRLTTAESNLYFDRWIVGMYSCSERSDSRVSSEMNFSLTRIVRKGFAFSFWMARARSSWSLVKRPLFRRISITVSRNVCIR